MGTTVVVGGGISGLVAAELLRRRSPSGDVVILEQSPSFGGLLGKVEAGPYGVFDLGMHTMTETGIPDLDALLRGLLPPDEWIHLAGAARDLSGLYFAQTLQHNAHHPDLRAFPPAQYERCLTDFFLTLQRSHPIPPLHMQAYGESRFGPVITDLVLAPAIRKTYGRDPREVHPLAARILPLDRVILFDEELFQQLMAAEPLRQRLAYPEQRNLPLQYASGRASYYPKYYGIHRVIDALIDRLQRKGVVLLSNTRVSSLERRGTAIVSVQALQNDVLVEIQDVHQVLWTTGPISLAKCLALADDYGPLDPPFQTVVVNFLFAEAPQMGDLYYFYCLDESHPTYRVTNYTNICPLAPRAGGYPICVELLLAPGTTASQDDYLRLARDELRSFGVIDPSSTEIYATAIGLSSGFPMLTCRNITIIDRLREAIYHEGLDNLLTAGVLSEPDLFYQTDVLADLYKKIG